MPTFPTPFVEPEIDKEVREAGTAPLAPKTAEYITHHFDTRRWELVTPREGDVLLGTYGKSGTTWMQQIVRNLLLDLPHNVGLRELTMWVEWRYTREADVESIVNKKHRRFLKHHLPQCYLPSEMRDKAVYVYIARDGRDAVWSLYNHHRFITQDVYQVLNSGEFDGPPFVEFDKDRVSEVEYFRRWLEYDGCPMWPFWSHIRSWWAVRHHPRVILVHYNNLKRDPSAEITRIYRLLKKTGDVRPGPEEEVVRNAVEHSTFEYMKRNANEIMSGVEQIWNGGATKIINKGTNGRWRDVIPSELSQKYEVTAVSELGPACAHWLETGEGDCNE